VNTIYLAEKNS